MTAVSKCAICLAAGLLGVQLAKADEAGQYMASLSGYNEVLAVSTAGSGQARAQVTDDRKSITIVLNYSKLTGSSPVAGLFFGRPGLIGNLLAVVCGGGGKACPATAGEVTTTIVAADVQAAATQGVGAKDFEALLQAIDAGAVYVNVVTDKYTGGEIRGQLARGVRQGADGGDDNQNGPPADNPGQGLGHGHQK